MNLARHTPHWLLHFLSDAALGFIWAIPNAFGLMIYATLAFLAIDALFKAINCLLNNAAFRNAFTEEQIGALPTRLRFLLLWIPSWVLKTIIGLPMLHVVNLVMSKDAKDIQALTALCSGAHWQTHILQELPRKTWLPFSDQSQIVYWLQFTIIATFLLYTYSYSVRGFDLVRRIRKVGDLILNRIKTTNPSAGNLSQALANLQAQGWTVLQCRAAAWFLIMVNLRILMRNVAYDQFKPKHYGIQQVVTQLAVASGLCLLTPVASGLFVAFELKKAGRLLKVASLFDTRFSQLPEALQQEVSGTYP